MVLAAMAAATLACVLAQAPPAGQAYLHERTEAGIPQPLDVAFDAEGRLIVAAGRQGLLRMEADGTRTVLAPGSVDRVPNVSRVEADPWSHAVQVKETSGVRTVDGATWAIGRLLAPEAAALAPDGSLWIADTGHARVVRVAPDGSAAAFGERGFFPGQFVAPSGIAFDAGGPLVADRLNHRVTRLAWDGSLRDVFGLHAFQPRQGEGRVHYPQAIAVDAASGRVAVAEPFERRVQVFRPATDVERARPMPPMPSKEGVSSHFGADLSVGQDAVAAWEPESGCVVVWDTRRDPPAHVTTFGGSGERPGLFLAPVSVLVEPDGDAVWVLDGVGDRLERWTLVRDREGPVQFDPFMARMDVAAPLTVARSEAGIAPIAASDLVWHDGRVGVVFADGSVAWTDPTLGRFVPDRRVRRPRNDGQPLRAADVGADGSLLLLWPNGIERRGPGDASLTPLARAARDPRGVLATPQGVLVSDADRDAIVRVDERGDLAQTIVAPREESARFDGVVAAKDGQCWLPARMAAGPRGTIWFVDYGNHRLQRLSADGAWEATFTLSRSRARDRSPPSEAPTVADAAREAVRRETARDRGRQGCGTVPVPGGGTLVWNAPSPVPVGEPFVMDVEARDATGAAMSGVQLLVDCTMPHHGHGMNVRPTVRRTGPGRWRVDPMLLHMPGRWELCLDLVREDGRVRRSQCSMEVE
jgi:sugar lactone lactonase YvrE